MAEADGDQPLQCMDLSRNMAMNEIGSKVHVIQTDLAFLNAEVNQDRGFLEVRLDEIESRLGCFEDKDILQLRLEEIESRLAAVENVQRFHSQVVESWQQAQEQANAEASVDDDLKSGGPVGEEADLVEYSLGSTVWDAPAFVGLPELGGSGASVIFFLVAVLNLVVQLFMTYQLLESGEFIKPRLFQEQLVAAQKWRLYEAHEYSRVDGSGVSLAGRVCMGDEALSVANAQTSLLSQINSYIGLSALGFEHTSFAADGPVLCLACVTLFAVVILKELRSLYEGVRAVLSVPRGKTTCIREGQLVSLSLVRFCFILLADFARLAVALALLLAGTMWLAFTSDITNLILNASALGFVMDLDEVLFEAGVPAVVQKFVANLVPLQYKRRRYHLEAALPLVFLVAIIVATAVLFVAPNTEQMLRVKEELCRGQLDFTVQLNQAGYIVAGATNHFMEEVAMNDPKAAAVEELRYIDDLSILTNTNPSFSLWSPTREMFARESQMLVETLAAVSFCDDLDTFNDGAAMEETHYLFLPIRNEVPHERGRPLCSKNGGPEDCVPFHCSAHAFLCHNVSMMRAVCPKTCGCHDPVSSQIFKQPRGGCPLSCEKEASLLAKPCVNLNVTQMASWREYWRNYMKWLVLMVPQAVDTYGYDNFIERKLSDGCNDLTLDPFGQHNFCDETEPIMGGFGLSSIRGFCPETCCRLSYQPERCPKSCPPPQ